MGLLGGILKGVGAMMFFLIGVIIAIIGFFIGNYIVLGIGVLCIIIAFFGR